MFSDTLPTVPSLALIAPPPHVFSFLSPTAILKVPLILLHFIVFVIGGWGRYLDELMKLRDQAHAEKNEFITWNDIQACVDHVNLVVQEEHESE